jgi:hypothetical protein
MGNQVSTLRDLVPAFSLVLLSGMPKGDPLPTDINTRIRPVYDIDGFRLNQNSVLWI